jgi:tyrosine-specific transport protein
MKSSSAIIGAILLIIGTSIGGGMLALPVATVESGLFYAFISLVFCWFVMTLGALLTLEVNLRLPKGSNMISMAKKTLGRPGEIITWIIYLGLLYTLLSGYISGGSDVTRGVLRSLNIDPNVPSITIIFTTFFGFIVYRGIKAVDYVNRGLMFGKLAAYIISVAIIAPYIKPEYLHHGAPKNMTDHLMVLITSFGFATIIPSIREYIPDAKKLRKIIIFGSLIPLVCYTLWITVIMGTVAEASLEALTTSNHATSGLVRLLNATLHNQIITVIFEFFTSICMLTAFLGVSLSLFDFIADGLKLKKRGNSGLIILALTFLPPLIVVLFNPGIYLRALDYAGSFCILLLLLLPALMAYSIRKKDKTLKPSGVAKLVLSYPMIILVVVLSIAVLYIQ